MTITVEQAENGYPLEAVRFFQTFEEYLSDETDEYGIKKCRQDSFMAFREVGMDVPDKLMKKYKKSVKAIHDYLDKGFQL